MIVGVFRLEADGSLTPLAGDSPSARWRGAIWDHVIANPAVDEDTWSICVDLFLPLVALKIMDCHMAELVSVLEGYENAMRDTGDKEGLAYLESLDDLHSKACHILKVRLIGEWSSTLAHPPLEGAKAAFDANLSDVREMFLAVPDYCLVSITEAVERITKKQNSQST